ncbi:transcription factor TFIIF complex subunit [Aspergillus brunneoviolaceus CBS 621.78]|uniref:Transcription factor TFIIF complex subunit n=1 Tax=Aspergillus brunneoviolaceus CBS 621.78 TaxID=1450534 RepID=A0ACD1FRM6_9EURO|nr:transcription factor TFIIF complex subunit [Aspergillus brunneoviolaceus CBS 621.78]RAH39625.1 transcription factor TFIIF complex subunit [Aspergillus brunneoviolaceus CBS 621.78]
MPDVERNVRLLTEQHILNKDFSVETFSLQSWSIDFYLVNNYSELVPANVFDQVTYTLHPSFGPRAVQTLKNFPFIICEEGWDEFDMEVGPIAADKKYFVTHDLNFAQARYESKHVITFKNPKPPLQSLVYKSGPVPGDKDRVKSKRAAGGFNSVDMDKLVDGLQRLGEDDLLQIVQMELDDNKAPDSYTKNDVEQVEFHVDLHILPDNLIKILEEFTQEKRAL